MMPSGTHVLQGEMVTLRLATPDDAARLADILVVDGVALWWGRWDVDRVHRDLLSSDDGAVAYVIEADGQVIGAIQYLEENEPEYRHASVDIFLHPGWHRRGLGSDAIRVLSRYLFTERGHHRLTIDPAAHNVAAIRSYGRVGFRPVGVMRLYERGRDGTWHDGLLMDLLADELC
jgi:aminoglycoside 6'-N-acetyltransferase